MIVERQLKYKASERVQKLPASKGAKIVGARWRQQERSWVTLLVELPESSEGIIDNTPGEPIRVRLTTQPVTGRDALTQQVVQVLKRGDTVTYVYDAKRRKDPKDFLFAKLELGFGIVN